MEFKINPSSWGAMFGVPSSVVDSHLKFAGATQLKVLLWIFRHAGDGIDIDGAVRAVGQPRAEILDALQFWVECGIIVKDEDALSPTVKSEVTVPFEPPKADEPKKQLAHLPISKPDVNQIAARITEEPELRMMYAEAQQKLGRTIGYDGQSSLLMIHDQYGLPVEVILMLIEYAVSEGKTSMAYISKVGREWGESEIDTLEKAEQRITQLRESKTLWSKFRARTGIQNPKPTAAQENFLIQWSQKLGFSMEMIYLAYEEMANHTSNVSFPYMNKILLSWHENGIRKPTDLENLRISRSKTKADAPAKSGQSASYDLDEFSRRALHEPLVYERGKK